MSMNIPLETMKIGSLFNKKFIIPEYQRGYRWNAQTQVLRLLEDIDHARVDNNSKDPEYCLQPIVVKQFNDDSYVVIDGQQRLTTIRLILEYLKFLYDRNPKKPFSIEYKTNRIPSEFLEIAGEPILESDNIDVWHIKKAFSKITEWFQNHDDPDSDFQNNFYQKLVGKAYVIWYCLADSEENEQTLFAKINQGKIPLSNSELIKALLLNKCDEENRRIILASEWDQIEKQLQVPDFWYFIFSNSCDDVEYSTRIDYLFDLISEKDKNNENDYFTYDYFSLKLQEGRAVREIWKEIKNYFMQFEDWYSNDTVYHLVGLLTATGKTIKYIRELSFVKGKPIGFDQFIVNLKKEAMKGHTYDELLNIDYQTDSSEKVRNSLLAMNIFSVISVKGGWQRFPFSRYREQKYDIEHVYSQTEKSIDGRDRFEWLKVMFLFISGKEYDEKDSSIDAFIASLPDDKPLFCQGIINSLRNPSNEKAFKEIRSKLDARFNSTSISGTNGIQNLVLLDFETNRGYKNAFFPVKREWIIRREKAGEFILPLTKNVFMKAYSKDADLMNWTEDNGKDYLNYISSIMKSEVSEDEWNKD